MSEEQDTDFGRRRSVNPINPRKPFRSFISWLNKGNPVLVFLKLSWTCSWLVAMLVLKFDVAAIVFLLGVGTYYYLFSDRFLGLRY